MNIKAHPDNMEARQREFDRRAAEKVLRDSPLGLAHPDNAELLSDWHRLRNCEMTFKAFVDKWLPYLERGKNE